MTGEFLMEGGFTLVKGYVSVEVLPDSVLLSIVPEYDIFTGGSRGSPLFRFTGNLSLSNKDIEVEVSLAGKKDVRTMRLDGTPFYIDDSWDTSGDCKANVTVYGEGIPGGRLSKDFTVNASDSAMYSKDELMESIHELVKKMSKRPRVASIMDGVDNHNGRTTEIMRDIFRRVAEYQIKYDQGNEGLLEKHQVVRSFREMCDNGGNCLDISCLFAACLHSVGLHPVMVFTVNHVIVGTVIDYGDIGVLTHSGQEDCKEIELPIDERVNGYRYITNIKAILIEPTSLCRGSDVSFEGALVTSKEKLGTDMTVVPVGLRLLNSR